MYMIAFRDRGTVLLTVLMSIAYDYVRCNLMHSSVPIRPLLNRTHDTRMIFMQNQAEQNRVVILIQQHVASRL